MEQSAQSALLRASSEDSFNTKLQQTNAAHAQQMQGHVQQLSELEERMARAREQHTQQITALQQNLNQQNLQLREEKCDLADKVAQLQQDLLRASSALKNKALEADANATNGEGGNPSPDTNADHSTEDPRPTTLRIVRRRR